jgi:hypothetical protein
MRSPPSGETTTPTGLTELPAIHTDHTGATPHRFRCSLLSLDYTPSTTKRTGVDYKL